MFRSIHSAERRENQFNGDAERSSAASYLIVASILSISRFQKKVDRLANGLREHRSEMFRFDELMTFRKDFQ
jgi:hypothetical protein